MGRFFAATGLLLFALAFSGCHTPRHAATVWEYRVIQVQPIKPMETAMNKAAEEGWEVVTIEIDSSNTSFAVLRRPRK